MKTAVLLLSLLCASTLVKADIFVEFPKDLSCQWILRYNGTDDKGYWWIDEEIHGDYMRLEREKSTNGVIKHELYVYRSDIVDSDNKIAKFAFNTATSPENSITYVDPKDVLYRPVSYTDREVTFSCPGEEVETDYYGQPCKMCNFTTPIYNGSVYYVDEGIIGLRYETAEVNFSRIQKGNVPLSTFVFPKSYVFDDDRIYTAPSKSTCSGSSSTSSTPASPTTSGASSMILSFFASVLLSVLILIAF